MSKTYRNNKTGEIIKVIDTFENIAILENREKIDIGLLNTDLFTEQVDPSSFFNNQSSYNLLAESIKSIPTDRMTDDEGEMIINMDGNKIVKPSFNDSAIIVSSEEDERAELAKKYGAINPVDSLNRQNEVFSKYLDDDDLPPVYEKRAEVVVNDVNMVQYQEPYIQPVQKVEDPIITMFKNVKRVKEFSVSIDISNKIPRLDFIEMMEDSYETSIIDYLSREFTNNLLKDPKIIEDMIKDKIKEMVYGVDKKVIKTEIKKEPKPKTPRKSVKKDAQPQ